MAVITKSNSPTIGIYHRWQRNLLTFFPLFTFFSSWLKYLIAKNCSSYYVCVVVVFLFFLCCCCCFEYYSFHLDSPVKVYGCWFFRLFLFYCVTFALGGATTIFSNSMCGLCVCVFYANYNFRLVSFSYYHKFLATGALSFLCFAVFFIFLK